MTIDLNDVVGVNAAGLRALSDALGDDGARVFINQFNKPRLTALQIADALERGKARAAANGMGRPGRDFTTERHEQSQKSFEEVTERIMAADAAEKARLGLSQ
jgi:hypothetical protein